MNKQQYRKVVRNYNRKLADYLRTVNRTRVLIITIDGRVRHWLPMPRKSWSGVSLRDRSRRGGKGVVPQGVLPPVYIDSTAMNTEAIQ